MFKIVLVCAIPLWAPKNGDVYKSKTVNALFS